MLTLVPPNMGKKNGYKRGARRHRAPKKMGCMCVKSNTLVHGIKVKVTSTSGSLFTLNLAGQTEEISKCYRRQAILST